MQGSTGGRQLRSAEDGAPAWGFSVARMYEPQEKAQSSIFVCFFAFEFVCDGRDLHIPTMCQELCYFTPDISFNTHDSPAVDRMMMVMSALALKKTKQLKEIKQHGKLTQVQGM